MPSYANTFEVMPAPTPATPHRTIRRPKIIGSQIALIAGPQGGRGHGAIVERLDSFPPAPSGPIAFQPWQIEELNERQWSISRQKIAKHLRDEYADQTRHLTDEELAKRVLHYEQEALSINLTTEKSFLNWARLNIETNNGASRNPDLKADIASWPDVVTDHLFEHAFPNYIQGYRNAKASAAGK